MSDDEIHRWHKDGSIDPPVHIKEQATVTFITDPMDDVLSRLDAIEARQRAYGQHDLDCSYAWVKDQSGIDCDCWLSEEP